MATTLRVRVEEDVTPYLRSIQKQMNSELRAILEKSSKNMQKQAKQIASVALAQSPGATGLLVSSITSATLYKRDRAQGWRVFVIGEATKYANEIENKKGLPRDRRASGKIVGWAERAEAGSGKKVPVRRGNLIRVGEGKSPYSIYSRCKQRMKNKHQKL